MHGGYLTPSSTTASWGTASTPGTEQQAADQGDMLERPAERPPGPRVAAGERVQVAVQRVPGGAEQVGLVLAGVEHQPGLDLDQVEAGRGGGDLHAGRGGLLGQEDGHRPAGRPRPVPGAGRCRWSGATQSTPTTPGIGAPG